MQALYERIDEKIILINIQPTEIEKFYYQQDNRRKEVRMGILNDHPYC